MFLRKRFSFSRWPSSLELTAGGSIDMSDPRLKFNFKLPMPPLQRQALIPRASSSCVPTTAGRSILEARTAASWRFRAWRCKCPSRPYGAVACGLALRACGTALIMRQKKTRPKNETTRGFPQFSCGPTHGSRRERILIL